MLQIEEAYQTLLQGTQYVYDRVNANEEIAEAWVRSELANAANAYQTLAQKVWQAILDRTQEDNQRQICQATQLTRVNDALAFLAEANTARSQHLVTFQGSVELWAADHQRKVNRMERELRQARDEIRQIAIRIPLPGSPTTRLPSPEPPHDWRSPVRQPSTSIATAPPPLPALRSPLRLTPAPPTRRLRRPAIPAAGPPTPPRPTTSEMRQRLEELRLRVSLRPPALDPAAERGGNPHSTPPGSSAGPPSGPSSEPPHPPFRRHPSPPPPRNSAPTITTQNLVRLVAEGVERARQVEQPAGGARVHTSRLKMENPEKFDRKSSTTFNQWWESVTMYLGFYPETTDRQKIAWVGTLLTDTALVCHLHRYGSCGKTTHGPTIRQLFAQSTTTSAKRPTPS